MVWSEKLRAGVGETFQTSLEHLLAELQRIELKLYLCVKSLHRGGKTNTGQKLRGLYISAEEIDEMLETPSILCQSTSPVGEKRDSIIDSRLISQLEEDVFSKTREAQARGQVLRLDRLAKLFHLSRFEQDILLMCLLSEIDIKYQRIYAYLQDDITKKLPTVDFALQLLCDSFQSRLEAREIFSSNATLMKYRLICLHDDQVSRPTLLLTKSIQMNERISGYLLGSDQIDPRLCRFAQIITKTLHFPDVILPVAIESRLQKLIPQFINEGIMCYLQGPHGVGKHTTAEVICSELKVPLLTIDASVLISAGTSPETLLSLLFCEGRIQNAAIYFRNFDFLLNDDKEIKLIYDRLIAECQAYPQWIFMAGEKAWLPREMSVGKPCINIEITTGSHIDRKQLWEKYLDAGRTEDVNLTEIAGKFRLSHGEVRDVIATARNLARWRDPEHGIISSEDLYTACRKQSRGTLSALAHKIQPTYHWEDIILPKDLTEQMQEICGYIKHYHLVYSEWGFGRKLATGKGLNMLFAGPSGTGKTMAAEIIASELLLDLYKIDLSSIISKYIGETEKNLDRIFKEGRTSNAILFFDEADALFGKRSEVRDSHDRYANIEVSYLLQKMDEYEGIVILATNLRKNMDEAFTRRMHYALEFPVPEEVDRLRIWQSIFPKEAPVSMDIDLNFMARQFKITGGSIKNIVLGAAFLAASGGGIITMHNLIKATRREYQKMGKLCTEGDFANYFEIVRS
jgi:AAA+ superfamily predicted ATPase